MSTKTEKTKGKDKVKRAKTLDIHRTLNIKQISQVLKHITDYDYDFITYLSNTSMFGYTIEKKYEKME